MVFRSDIMFSQDIKQLANTLVGPLNLAPEEAAKTVGVFENALHTFLHNLVHRIEQRQKLNRPPIGPLEWPKNAS